MELRKGDYVITDDRERIDLSFVISSLHKTYWASSRAPEVILESIENSICLSLLKSGNQIGFARIVTDKATFAWIADVYIDEEHRGIGLGEWLVETTNGHPAIKNASLHLLKTRDAHGLYEKFGFVRDDCLTRRHEG